MTSPAAQVATTGDHLAQDVLAGSGPSTGAFRIIDAACHCGAFTLTATLDAFTLPQSHTYCHCWSCRHRTGTMAIAGVYLPASYIPPADVRARLKTHTTHRGKGAPVSSHFCGTCGAVALFSVISRSRGAEMWVVSLGLVKDPKGLVRIDGHSHLEDTGDGGVSGVLSQGKVDGAVSGGTDPSLGQATSTAARGSTRSAHLALKCSCGAFKARIAPHTATDRPGTATTKLGIASKPARYPIYWCACDSCRATSGSMLPAVAYAQIPIADIHLYTLSATPSLTPLADALEPAANDLGLARYASSPDVTRFHCSTCGTHIFKHDKRAPEEVSAFAGIADNPSGARGDAWLDWRAKGGVQHAQDGRRRDEVVMREWEEGVAR